MPRPKMHELIFMDVFLMVSLLFVFVSPILVVSFSLLGTNFFDPKTPLPPKTSAAYEHEFNRHIGFSCALMAAGTICALVRGYRVWCLVKYGVVVTGRVVSAGSLVCSGHRDITYSFEFRNRVIQNRVSVPALDSRYNESDDVTILFDERNPDRNMLI